MSLQYSYYLLGIMQGFSPEGIDVALEITAMKVMAAQNSGIAAIIPAWKIATLLGTPRALAHSERVAANAYLRKGKLDESERLFKAAIDRLAESAPEHSDLAVALEDYAHFLRSMNRTGEANAAEGRAKLIRQNVQADRLHPKL